MVTSPALAPLGTAAVDDAHLTAIVADLLGHDPSATTVHDVRVEEVAYDVPAITTAGRHWVRGRATTPGGDQAWSVFVKHVQCWSRHPFFAFVPEPMRAAAAAGVPWRAEPLAYRSDLRDRLPEGLTMLRALDVVDLDALSAAVWLPEVEVEPATWDLERYRRAAHLVGRLAASRRVREVRTVADAPTPWDYLHGRLAGQVLPALRDDAVWQHPLVAGAFDDDLRTRLRAAGDRAQALTAELCALPVRAAHGDTCPGNLLVSPGVDGFVLIDFGFFCPQPVGFDLAQLLVGEVQVGRRTATDLAVRDEACTAAYVEGLRAEGDDTPAAVVRRGHALKLLLYVGLSTLPVEHLGADPTPELHEVAAERAAIARYSLHLVEQTEPGA